MKYPYFRGLEADRYSFYRVPKALIKVDLFEKMSGDAKLLYAVLLDRMNVLQVFCQGMGCNLSGQQYVHNYNGSL